MFFSAIAVQLLFFALYFVVLTRKSPEAEPTGEPVSVIVCAHDEEENLRELLPLLLQQAYNNFEVIIVNDRSNDGTYDLLLDESRKHKKLKIVHVDRVPDHVNGKKYGLTLGIKAASHEWILLTDADCRPGADWVKEMSRNFREGASIVTGVSPYEKRAGMLNLFIRFDAWVTALQYVSLGGLRTPYMGVGRNLAYRKSFFLEKKGFNDLLGITGGDDDLFVNRHANSNNVTLAFGRETAVPSIPKRTRSAFVRQKLRHLAVGKHYRAKHRIILGTFMLSWIVTWFAAVPLFVVGWHPWWVASALAIRTVFLTASLKALLSRWRMSFEWWAIPFLDFLYAIYYISTGVAALSMNKVQWTK